MSVGEVLFRRMCNLLKRENEKGGEYVFDGLEQISHAAFLPSLLSFPSLPPSLLTNGKQVPVMFHVAQDGVPRLQHRLIGVLRAIPELGDGLVVQACVWRGEGRRGGMCE